jgi:hypothetical protein
MLYILQAHVYRASIHIQPSSEHCGREMSAPTWYAGSPILQTLPFETVLDRAFSPLLLVCTEQYWTVP